MAGPALLVIGSFDGVHRGHRFLLEQAAQRAQEHNFGLVIVTFDPVPAVVLRPEIGRYQLTSAAQKLRLLEPLGPAMVLMLRFSHELAALTADQFLDALEERLVLREMWLGDDFHFGKDRAGGLSMLVERGSVSGFSLHVVARRTEDRATISSSRVRQALVAGDVAHALPLLGRPFAVEVTAATGVPTAGVPLICEVPVHLALPAYGSYAALLTRAVHEALPTLARVRRDGEKAQVALWTQEAVEAPREVEFIARLETGDREPDAELEFDQARALLKEWQRPVYPASSDY